MAKMKYKYVPYKGVLKRPEVLAEEFKRLKKLKRGGFDPVKVKLQPLQLAGASFGGDGDYFSDVLDSITAAMESGLVDSETWPTQLFADEASFDNFLRELSSYEECYKLVDPWWQALRYLAAGTADWEEGVATAEQLAVELRRVVDEELEPQWQ